MNKSTWKCAGPVFVLAIVLISAGADRAWALTDVCTENCDVTLEAVKQLGRDLAAWNAQRKMRQAVEKREASKINDEVFGPQARFEKILQWAEGISKKDMIGPVELQRKVVVSASETVVVYTGRAVTKKKNCTVTLRNYYPSNLALDSIGCGGKAEKTFVAPFQSR